MPQGERNGDSLNTLFKKMLGYILRYVDYYYDNMWQDVNGLKMSVSNNLKVQNMQHYSDVNGLKISVSNNLKVLFCLVLGMLMFSKCWLVTTRIHTQ